MSSKQARVISGYLSHKTTDFLSILADLQENNKDWQDKYGKCQSVRRDWLGSTP